uniref:Uncharacterized protein n=1 Tax=Glossina palpalis gambiensis TaxID=67801 RepID=A0A1B0C0I8_9MUSC
MFGLKSSTGSGPNSSYGYSQYQFGESKRRNKMFLTKGLSKLKPSNQYSQVLPGIRKLKNFPENGTQIKDQPSAAANFKPPPFDSKNTQPLSLPKCFFNFIEFLHKMCCSAIDFARSAPFEGNLKSALPLRTTDDEASIT